MHEQKRHRLADNIAAAEHDGVGALDGDLAAAKNLHATRGSAGDKPGAPTDEPAKIDRMEAIHVFRGMHGFQDALGVHLRRKRKLDKDAVDVVVVIQVIHNSEKLPRGHGGRWCEEAARQPKLFAGGNFAFHVELRCGIFADENGSKAGLDAGGGQHANFVLEFGEDLVPDFLAIENACSRAPLAFLKRKRIIA